MDIIKYNKIYIIYGKRVKKYILWSK
eukprot:SAG11_NODE_46676_length_134_cov_362.657143_1_plen_25_part_10